MSTERSTRRGASLSKAMDSDNGGSSSGGNDSGLPEVKRRRLMPPSSGPNGAPRNGPRTRAKIENETLLMMDDERKEQEEELDKNAMSNEDANMEDQDPDQDQPHDENAEQRLDHDDDISSSSSSSDSSDSSDSDDSSEMDEETTDKKKAEYQADMQDLEKQFLYLREIIYREKITHVHQIIEAVRTGKAREYLGPLEELQENMRIRIEVASKQRNFRTKGINLKYEADKVCLQQDLENERQLIYDTIRSDLEDRIHRLELDRNNDFTSEYWFTDPTLKRKTKKSLDIFGEKKKKAITVNGPYIVYMLSDIDIVDDWTVLKKALNAPKRKFNGEGVLAY